MKRSSSDAWGDGPSSSSASISHSFSVVSLSQDLEILADNGADVAVGLSPSGIVFVDVMGTFTIATNIVSYEKRRLEGEWDLHFSADGDSAVLVRVDCGSDGNEIMYLEDCFKKSVFRKAKTGELWLVDGGGAERKQYSLDVEVMRHRSARATITAGASSATADLDVSVFRRPRMGAQMCFWSLQSVYKFLACDTYGGLASKWVHRRCASWDAWLTNALCSGQIVYGSHVSTEWTHKRNAMLAPQRCIESTSVSTAGLLLLMLRFTSMPRESGGLAAGKPREAVGLLVDALLAFLEQLYPPTLTFEIQVCETWTCPWPRPLPRAHDSTHVRLELIRGTIHVGELAASLTRCGSRIARTWVSELAVLLVGVNGSIGVGRFLRWCVTRKALTPLLSQLVLPISVALERQLAAAGKQTARQGEGAIRFRWDDDDTGFRLHKMLLSHIAGGIKAFAGESVFGIPTDKGICMGFPLQAMVITAPSSIAAFAVPQVRVGFGAGAGAGGVCLSWLRSGPTELPVSLHRRIRLWSERGSGPG